MKKSRVKCATLAGYANFTSLGGILSGSPDLLGLMVFSLQMHQIFRHKYFWERGDSTLYGLALLWKIAVPSSKNADIGKEDIHQVCFILVENCKA